MTKEIISIFQLWTFHLYVATPAYVVYMYISELIRYSRACGSYHDFLDGGLQLIRKLLNKGFLVAKSSLCKLYGLHHHLVTECLCHKCSISGNHNPVLSSFMIYQRAVTRVTRRVPHAEQEHPTLLYYTPEFLTSFMWGSCCFIISFLSNNVL